MTMAQLPPRATPPYRLAVVPAAALQLAQPLDAMPPLSR